MFPFTIPIGVISKPKHWAFWFIRWDVFAIRCFWCILLVPLMELWGLYWNNRSWTHLGHLFGLICGVAVVLILPKKITIPRRGAAASY